MSRQAQIPTSRMEAFSDGVIAIIITIMVFDLKLAGTPTEETIERDFALLAPKFIWYAFSFLMLAIMWVNHHQLFHQIKHTDRHLLWHSVHLLFWMSLVPFATSFIGSNPFLWQASAVYGMVFFMNAWAFNTLRGYVVRHSLLHDNINKHAHLRIRSKNKVALAVYLVAAVVSTVSVYISFILFLVVPAMYFIPEKITQINED